MTYEQRELLRESFAMVRPMAVPVTMLFYGRLFELDPSLRALFPTDMREQSRKLSETLSVAVESLDQFDALRPGLRELGAQHLTYGARPEHYRTLVSALLWALGQALQSDLDPQAREAWRVALEAISAEMIAGAEAAAPPSAC